MLSDLPAFFCPFYLYSYMFIIYIVFISNLCLSGFATGNPTTRGSIKSFTGWVGVIPLLHSLLIYNICTFNVYVHMYTVWFLK